MGLEPLRSQVVHSRHRSDKSKHDSKRVFRTALSPQLSLMFDSFSITHVLRAQNKRADALANNALDIDDYLHGRSSITKLRAKLGLDQPQVAVLLNFSLVVKLLHLFVRFCVMSCTMWHGWSSNRQAVG